MVILDIKLLSGFVPDTDSLQNVSFLGSARVRTVPRVVKALL